MKINWGSISQAEFFENYWQQRPILLKGAVADFQDPIDANDLAGLAMEEVVESRIVSHAGEKWNVAHGPFEQFDDLPENGWSLLVQGVDRWSSEVFKLRSLIEFLPSWLIDDVMVSYSAKKGGVGPHLDQYNVFILQGEGKRHWKVGAVDKDAEQLEVSDDLLQTTPFEPIIDAILEPGDLLYIPPFSPHCGTSIEPSLNYSLGLRAPSQSELLTCFADYVFENELGKSRFALPNLNNILDPNITGTKSDDFSELKAFMLEAINSENFESFIHQFVTEPTRELDIVPVEIELDESQVFELLSNSSVSINKVFGLQTSYFLKDNVIHFYCNGNLLKAALSQKDFIKHLHTNQLVDPKVVKSSLSQLENVSLLTTLINTGFWYIEEAK